MSWLRRSGPAVTTLDESRELPGSSLSIELEIAAFVHAHHSRLIRLAGLICHDIADAEDAVQAAFERAWRQRQTLRDPNSLKSWLDRIVVREAIRISRPKRSLLSPFVREPVEIDVGPVGPRDPTASAAAGRAALRAAFDALPPAQRGVVVLHLHAGYSMPETAELMDIPLETARSRLRLARARLRERLGEATP